MSTATLTIDLGALVANWHTLDAMTRAETAAVVKADAYGLGMAQVGRALAAAGARTFFVALAEEGAVLRQVLGLGPTINVFAGHMAGDATLLGQHALTPMINSIDQLIRHVEALPGHPFGVQLDSGMNRLGMEPAEWAAVRDIALLQEPTLIMSHLACADEPDHALNQQQLATFRRMTAGTGAQLSLANTGGVLLGQDYHFDLVRPGIGVYGGLPFEDAKRVVGISVPVIQGRDVEAGETVGYGNSVTITRPMRIATISAGYADGLHRALSNRAQVFASGKPCPVIGRVSMDMIGIDITGLKEDPDAVEVLGPHQTIDALADRAGTIGYEILTSLGPRYTRHYTGL